MLFALDCVLNLLDTDSKGWFYKILITWIFVEKYDGAELNGCRVFEVQGYV